MKTKIPAPFIRVFSIFLVVFIGTEIYLASEEPGYSHPTVAAFYLIVILVLVIAEKLKVASENLYTDHVSQEEKEAFLAEKEAHAIKDFKSLMQALTKAKSIKEESSIEMNHEYDGIRELDNDLPPWWVYLFYVTIVFAGIYLGYYGIFGGPDQTQEYKEQVAIAKAEIEAYQKTVKTIDLNNLEASADSGALSKGKKLFKQNCAACHMVDGRGSIGPNLTDEYWILGGGIKNVYNTIANGGRPGKGMIAWKNSFSQEKIQQLANYVLSLQGTNPENAKAPEGEKWTEE